VALKSLKCSPDCAGIRKLLANKRQSDLVRILRLSPNG
jgi:hypothetical protein